VRERERDGNFVVVVAVNDDDDCLFTGVSFCFYP
jgi:hypothetical protein